MRRRTIPISFRVDEDVLRRIEDECKPYGISRGDWVRGVVISRLHAADQTELLAQLEHLIGGVSELHVLVSRGKEFQERSFAAMLHHVGNLDLEEVRQILRQVSKEGGTA